MMHLPIPNNHHSPPGKDRQLRIFNFLNSHPVAVLSVVDPSGEPHGSVIYYMVDQQFRLRFVTKTGTRKFNSLRQHNRVVLTVFDDQALVVTQVFGTVQELTDSTVINEVAGAVFASSLATAQAGSLPISKLEAGEYTGYLVQPSQINLARYPMSGDYTERFDTIESFELWED